MLFRRTAFIGNVQLWSHGCLWNNDNRRRIDFAAATYLTLSVTEAGHLLRHKGQDNLYIHPPANAVGRVSYIWRVPIVFSYSRYSAAAFCTCSNCTKNRPSYLNWSYESMARYRNSIVDGLAVLCFTPKQVFGPRTTKSQPIWIKFCTLLLLYGIHLWVDLDRNRRVGGSRPNQNDCFFL